MAADAGSARLERWLEQSGALRRGHFRLSSGLHSPAYVQCALLLQEPRRARAIGRALADRLRPFDPESVVAPALGGLIVGHEVAAALDVPFRFTEREGDRMVLRRGFALRPGERFVLVEDVVTTGVSSREAIAAAVASGGDPRAVGAILDRTRGERPFDLPLVALSSLEFDLHEPASCPLCREGRPLEKPGSRPSPGRRDRGGASPP